MEDVAMIKSGILIPVLIMVPNLIYFLNMRNKTDVPANKRSASKFSQMSENIGRLGILFTPIFYALNLNDRFSLYFIILCLIFLTLYYAAWIRHFVSGSQQIDMRLSLLVPLPLAVYPSLFLICSSYLLSSVPMLMASLIFSIAHIRVTYIES
jgi:hypothetical protein